MRNIANSPDGTSLVVEAYRKVVGAACFLHLTDSFAGLPDPGEIPGEILLEVEKMGSGPFKQ